MTNPDREALADDIETIILRRLKENHVAGYAREMAEEIVQAVSALPAARPVGQPSDPMTDEQRTALADKIISDAMIAYEEHPVPPPGAADGSWQAMKDVLKVGIIAALRSTLASVDVTGMSEAQIEDIRSHIRGSTEEKATYDYELGSGWRCFHCGEMFRTPGGAALHFGKPTDKPACTPASGQPSGPVDETLDALTLIKKYRAIPTQEAQFIALCIAETTKKWEIDYNASPSPATTGIDNHSGLPSDIEIEVAPAIPGVRGPRPFATRPKTAEREALLEEALNERDLFINPHLLEQAANEIDCCPDCDHLWHEHDVNAWGCHAAEDGEYCPNDVAETLRAVAKMARAALTPPTEEAVPRDEARFAKLSPDKPAVLPENYRGTAAHTGRAALISQDGGEK